ncbi:MAG: TetR/AcrR family transcriptional regulator [Steroidobacteraceae bacterium]
MAESKKKAVSRAPRLGADDWVRAGLVTLARYGMANVRIERLARDLKVTKGSFYWHFKDRKALLDAMLAEWRVYSNHIIELAIEQHPEDAFEQLRTLMRAPQTANDTNEGSRIELALRLWARRDKYVSAMLRDLYRYRHKTMAKILTGCGVGDADLLGLTRILAATMTVLWITDGLGEAERDSLINQMIDIVKRYAAAQPVKSQSARD